MGIKYIKRFQRDIPFITTLYFANRTGERIILLPQAVGQDVRTRTTMFDSYLSRTWMGKPTVHYIYEMHLQCL